MLRVEIRLVEGDHTLAEKSAFMKKATEVVLNILRCPIDDIRVSIVEYKPENTSKGGVSILEMDKHAHC